MKSRPKNPQDFSAVANSLHENGNDDFSDEEEGGQIVYNHNYLENVLGLYKGKDDPKETTTSTPAVDPGGIENEILSSNQSQSQKIEEIASEMQRSMQEKIARASLEKLHTISFGRAQSKFSKMSFDDHLFSSSQDAELLDLVKLQQRQCMTDNHQPQSSEVIRSEEKSYIDQDQEKQSKSQQSQSCCASEMTKSGFTKADNQQSQPSELIRTGKRSYIDQEKQSEIQQSQPYFALEVTKSGFTNWQSQSSEAISLRKRSYMDREKQSECLQSQPCSASEVTKSGIRNHKQVKEDSYNDASNWSSKLKEAEEFEKEQFLVSQIATQPKRQEQRILANASQRSKKLKYSIRRPSPSSTTSKGVNQPMMERFIALLESSSSKPGSRECLGMEKPQANLSQSSSQENKFCSPKNTSRQMNGKVPLSISSTRDIVAKDKAVSSSSTEKGKIVTASDPCHVTKSMPLLDRFQEALNAVPEHERDDFFRDSEGPAFGLHNRLQKILQLERKNHTQFKILSSSIMHCNINSIDVRIQSKCFEAKLTICKCTIEKVPEEIPEVTVLDYKVSDSITVIFSPRVNGNLEIEIGNIIQLHPPWREIQIAEKESVVICSNCTN